MFFSSRFTVSGISACRIVCTDSVCAYSIFAGIAAFFRILRNGISTDAGTLIFIKINTVVYQFCIYAFLFQAVGKLPLLLGRQKDDILLYPVRLCGILYIDVFKDFVVADGVFRDRAFVIVSLQGS